MGDTMVSILEDIMRYDAWTAMLDKIAGIYPFDENVSRTEAYQIISKIVGGALMKWGQSIFDKNKKTVNASYYEAILEGENPESKSRLLNVINNLESDVYAFLKSTRPWRLVVRDTKWYDTILSMMKGSDYQRAFDNIWKHKISLKLPGQQRKQLTNSLHEGKIHSKTDYQGLSITIEVPAGGLRTGKGKDGVEWERKVKDNYGYILNTNSPDGEHLDCWLKKSPKKNAMIYVIHQMTVDGKKYDEDKVMLGYNSKDEAIEAYKYNCVEPSKQFGGVSEFDLDHFKVIAYAASNSTAMLGREETVDKMRDNDKLPRGIKSPVEVAMAVKESLEFNTDIYGGVTITKNNTRCYLNGGIAESLLEQIEQNRGNYKTLLGVFMENMDNSFVLESNYQSYGVATHMTDDGRLIEGMQDVYLFDGEDNLVNRVTYLNQAQLDSLITDFTKSNIADKNFTETQKFMVPVTKYIKENIDLVDNDGPAWIAEHIERKSGINYFELLPVVTLLVNEAKRQSKETELNAIKESLQNEIVVEEIEKPSTPMDDIVIQDICNMAQRYTMLKKQSTVNEQSQEMLSLLATQLFESSRNHGFSSTKAMFGYIKEHNIKKKH